ncbi:SH3-domain-containing protein [Bimuria novae-zelandiae CBS 107.79]|uniref:SH3-domain-containing protein n=1 Tax=Bimuria novae-zelandiae CBS 107.79 TaxID=1447943 RepID=A0A6A5UI17_9PLEO|nr:SH3-domain-containing protein [Bimuria novae-zelandiae CBS 107.79]
MADGFNNAMINRSLRAIKTELEFLVDSNVISQAQYDTIFNQLPASATSARALPAAPTQQMSSLSVKTPEPEKKANGVGYYANNASNPPPPAYPTPPAAPVGPPVLCHATAMYQYNAQDAGDLALMPNDKIVVTEYMNNEWWKGRNDRTGQEGIFPASYVRREEKAVVAAQTNYGNMPLDVSNGHNGAMVQQPNTPHEPSKLEEGGKKFGKKLGNAAVFGAGATIGSKIVNGIF